MGSEIFQFSLHDELTMLVRLLVAVLAGSIIGFERRRSSRPAGIRTVGLVAGGSAIFTLVSIFGFQGLGDMRDPARVAAQIVTGVGFIGAGVMIRGDGGTVRGLTTAGSIWIAAALGMAAGAGMYVIAVAGSILTVVVLHFFPRKAGE
ncbi:MAG: MgtC/SapB family protein [Dehalococcoidia bacterium]